MAEKKNDDFLNTSSGFPAAEIRSAVLRLREWRESNYESQDFEILDDLWTEIKDHDRLFNFNHLTFDKLLKFIHFSTKQKIRDKAKVIMEKFKRLETAYLRATDLMFAQPMNLPRFVYGAEVLQYMLDQKIQIMEPDNLKQMKTMFTTFLKEQRNPWIGDEIATIIAKIMLANWPARNQKEIEALYVIEGNSKEQIAANAAVLYILLKVALEGMRFKTSWQLEMILELTTNECSKISDFIEQVLFHSNCEVITTARLMAQLAKFKQSTEFLNKRYVDQLIKISDEFLSDHLCQAVLSAFSTFVTLTVSKPADSSRNENLKSLFLKLANVILKGDYVEKAPFCQFFMLFFKHYKNLVMEIYDSDQKNTVSKVVFMLAEFIKTKAEGTIAFWYDMLQELKRPEHEMLSAMTIQEYYQKSLTSPVEMEVPKRPKTFLDEKVLFEVLDGIMRVMSCPVHMYVHRVREHKESEMAYIIVDYLGAKECVQFLLSKIDEFCDNPKLAHVGPMVATLVSIKELLPFPCIVFRRCLRKLEELLFTFSSDRFFADFVEQLIILLFTLNPGFFNDSDNLYEIIPIWCINNITNKDPYFRSLGTVCLVSLFKKAQFRVTRRDFKTLKPHCWPVIEQYHRLMDWLTFEQQQVIAEAIVSLIDFPLLEMADDPDFTREKYISRWLSFPLSNFFVYYEDILEATAAKPFTWNGPDLLNVVESMAQFSVVVSTLPFNDFWSRASKTVQQLDVILHSITKHQHELIARHDFGHPHYELLDRFRNTLCTYITETMKTIRKLENWEEYFENICDLITLYNSQSTGFVALVTPPTAFKMQVTLIELFGTKAQELIESSDFMNEARAVLSASREFPSHFVEHLANIQELMLALLSYDEGKFVLSDTCLLELLVRSVLLCLKSSDVKVFESAQKTLRVFLQKTALSGDVALVSLYTNYHNQIFPAVIDLMVSENDIFSVAEEVLAETLSVAFRSFDHVAPIVMGDCPCSRRLMAEQVGNTMHQCRPNLDEYQCQLVAISFFAFCESKEKLLKPVKDFIAQRDQITGDSRNHLCLERLIKTPEMQARLHTQICTLSHDAKVEGESPPPNPLNDAEGGAESESANNAGNSPDIPQQPPTQQD